MNEGKYALRGYMGNDITHGLGSGIDLCLGAIKIERCLYHSLKSDA